MGRNVDSPANELVAIRHTAELHDVGKMAIPDGILDKRGPLTPEEWAFIHQQTVVGQRIVSAAVPGSFPAGRSRASSS